MKKIRDNRSQYTVLVQPRAMDHFDFNQILDAGTKAVGSFSALFGSGGSTQVDNTAVQNFLSQQAALDRAAAQPINNNLTQGWLKMDRLAIAVVAAVVIIAAVGAFVLFKK